VARADAARKAKWSAYVKGKLAATASSPAELSRKTGIPNKTIYNWTLGDGVASAENCLILAGAFGVSAFEVLSAAGYEILAQAMAGKEIRLVGAEPMTPDPGIVKIMSRDDIPDDVKATLIQWWIKRSADDEARRLADADQMIELQTDRNTA
jgi:hypothetical protein